MGSGGNGPYSTGTSGTTANVTSFSSMHQGVESWARKMQDKLSGNQLRRFNTACIVIDKETGKFYYGRNHGIEYEHAKKHPTLFGDKSHDGVLPKASLNGYDIGNCAEVDAVNKALNAGARLENLQMMTIHATKKSFGKQKHACENCTAAFKGRIAGNYSGWEW